MRRRWRWRWAPVLLGPRADLWAPLLAAGLGVAWPAIQTGAADRADPWVSSGRTQRAATPSAQAGALTPVPPHAPAALRGSARRTPA